MNLPLLAGLAMVLALLGHTSFWVGLVNRMHSRAWPEALLRGLTLVCALVWGLLAAGFLWELTTHARPEEPGNRVLEGWFSQLAWPWQAYLIFCWLIAGRNLWAWLWRHLLHRPPHVLLRQQVEAIPVPEADQNRADHHPMVWLPQNEILRIELTRREIQLAHLPPQLNGLTLLHLSDLHFTGRVAPHWFYQAMEFCAQLKPDLVALTGDFLDTMECLNWIPEVLAPLKGRSGVYFILGNHDWRLDWRRIREEIEQLGFVWLGGRWRVVCGRDMRMGCQDPFLGEKPAYSNGSNCSPPQGSLSEGHAGRGPEGEARIHMHNEPVVPLPAGSEQYGEGQILLAGNELPWIGPAPDLKGAPPPASQGGPIRILLAHSPDQLGWARKHQFDLMLAGHTHGGQIRIPLIGPILTPSSSGVRYSGGVFHEPPTVLHVTRGISAEWPLRWNCPPEVVLLSLRSPFLPSQTS